jgi:AraC family L-rhamnose operon regulatory protein RhaS
VTAPKLIQSPINPEWLIPEGWEHILGVHIDYRLGQSVLHLLRVQWNQHVGAVDGTEPHNHSYHQLLYYQRGEGQLLTSNEVYSVNQGSIFFVPAGCQHHFKGEAGEAALCLALDFTVDKAAYAEIDITGLPMDDEVAVLLSLLHTENARPFHLQAVDQAQVDSCIALIVAENDEREVGYASMIQAHLLRLIALCLRATQRAQGFGQHFRHTAWRHRLIAERAQSIIREHATRHNPELSLVETARTCSTSANHLNRILKRHTGQTFNQLLLRHRLDCAAKLLRAGEANCTEAAFAAGFNDSNYFARAFRKVFGHTPSQLGRDN